MIHLILKDFYVNRKYLVFVFLFLSFTLLSMDNLELSILFVMSVISYGTVARSCYNDDRDRGGIFLRSLPIRASTIVFSKYVLGFVILLVTIAIFLLLSLIRGHGLEIYYGSISVAIFTMSLVYAIYLPVFFKYGYMKAITFQTMFFIGIMLSSAGFRSLTNIAKSSNVIDQDQWLIAILVDFIRMIPRDSTTLMIISCFTSLIMLTISIVLSLKFYNNSSM